MPTTVFTVTSRPTTKGEYLLEALREDLQTLCVENDWSLTAIWDRLLEELPLSDDEARIAHALDPGDED